MRKLIIAGLMFCTSSAWAQTGSIGEAIEPLLPGVTVRVVRESPRVVNGADQCAGLSPTIWECPGSPPFPPNWTIFGPFTVGFDAAGNAYHVTNINTGFEAGKSGNLLRRVSPAGVMEDVARVLRQLSAMRFAPQGAAIDVTGGRIWMMIMADRYDALQQIWIPTTVGTVEISGLSTLFDTLLTFVPGGQTISALTPAHPDGFRSADSMQVWTGNVRSLPDWSRAEPLACSAATNPTPGQLVSVADTLPDPGVGEGRYYLVASQSGADRRLGRQRLAGGLAPRDPSTLPVCQ